MKYTVPVTLGENEYGISKIDILVEAVDGADASAKAAAFLDAVTDFNINTECDHEYGLSSRLDPEDESGERENSFWKCGKCGDEKPWMTAGIL